MRALAIGKSMYGAKHHLADVKDHERVGTNGGYFGSSLCGVFSDSFLPVSLDLARKTVGISLCQRCEHIAEESPNAG